VTVTELREDGREILTFSVAGERLALAAGEIEEIIRPRPLTRVPHGPPSLLGVVNLRGGVLPVISLARMLDREPGPAAGSNRIVVVNRNSRFGLLVDQVFALTRTADSQAIDLGALLARDFGGVSRPTGGRAEIPAGATSSAPKDSEDTGDLALITFLAAGQEYALSLDKVAEVLALPAEITEAPGTDGAMIGVTALRGRLLPLASLHVLLGLKARGNEGKPFVVVTRLGGALVGLVVDRLGAILRAPIAALDPVPPVLTRGKAEARIDAICRLDRGMRLVSILSPERLFDDETTSRIMGGTNTGGAEVTEDRSDSQDTQQFVIFTLGTEHYGLPIASVDEVVRRPDRLTRVPHAPAFVAGVMNLRGRVIPVIDQHRRFSVPGADGTAARRIVVVTIEGLRAGFVVDEVSEVLAISTSELMPAPNLTHDDTRIFDRVATIERGGRMILIIDPKALLDQAERDILQAIAAGAEVAAMA
jgi:purine-binding chemotaxis protein CheW